jgi:hypothetical protein
MSIIVTKVITLPSLLILTSASNGDRNIYNALCRSLGYCGSLGRHWEFLISKLPAHDQQYYDSPRYLCSSGYGLMHYIQTVYASHGIVERANSRKTVQMVPREDVACPDLVVLFTLLSVTIVVREDVLCSPMVVVLVPLLFVKIVVR